MIYRVPECKLHLSGITYAQYPATIRTISWPAGAQLGRATLGWPDKFAAAQNTKFGDRASITVGNDIVFRGCIAASPLAISDISDGTELDLYCDKWLMSRRIIGQTDIGTQTITGSGQKVGFRHVGFDIVFNADNLPNKQPGAMDFERGPDADWWTLKDIMEFLFHHYIDSKVAALDLARLGSAYDQELPSINLVGQTALQAVDTVVELSGESWALKPTEQHSEFVPLRAGGFGRTRQITVREPATSAAAPSTPDPYIADAVDAVPTLENARDTVQVMSAPIMLESIFTNTGESPLLEREDLTGSEFAVRYRIDVTKYQAHGLGCDLPAGAKPKPIANRLLTRVKSTGGYYTAAELLAKPALNDAPRADIPVWVSTTGAEAAAQLVLSGVRIDADQGLIYFQRTVKLLKSDNTSEDKTITDWSSVGVWVTLAIRTERVEAEESLDENKFLPDPFVRLIQRSDLVPEQRFNAWLPGTTPNTIDKVATTIEKYVDVTDALEAACASAAALSEKIENNFTLLFRLMPVMGCGELVRIIGRNIGQQGDEIITGITYDVHDRYLTRVEVSNNPAAAGGKKTRPRIVNFGAKPDFGPRVTFGPRVGFGTKPDFRK